MNQKKTRSKTPKEQRALAEKALEALQQAQMIIHDPETSPEKLAEIERILRRCHALYYRGRK